MLNEIITNFFISLLILVALVVMLTIFYYLSDWMENGEYNQERKKHIKYLGKGYYKVINYLYMHRMTFSRKWSRLSEMIEAYEESPEDYYIFMLKYEYAFTLIKNMLEEAEERDVQDDKRLEEKVQELIDTIDVEFTEVQDRKNGIIERDRTVDVTAINNQIEEEIKYIEEIRKMRRK